MLSNNLYNALTDLFLRAYLMMQGPRHEMTRADMDVTYRRAAQIVLDSNADYCDSNVKEQMMSIMTNASPSETLIPSLEALYNQRLGTGTRPQHRNQYLPNQASSV